MKLSDQEMERVLRSAPKPKAPVALRQQLTARLKLNTANDDSHRAAVSSGLAGWLRRWWPALAPASVSLVCAAVMVLQEAQVRALQQGNLRLAEQRAASQTAAPSATAASARPAAGESDVATAEQEEIARLKARARQLGTEVARLEKLQAENEVLRKQPVTPAGLIEEEFAAVAKEREKAISTHCVNNLKQIGLAVRMWQLDHGDVSPPNFLSMSNELNTPKILVCTADTNRVAATTFANYTDANCSYEYLTPSAKNANFEPQRVLTRCPIHGHVGLCDGSVQGNAWKRHPEHFVERDKKLYYEPPRYFDLPALPSSRPDR